jgi:hypothetical protein
MAEELDQQLGPRETIISGSSIGGGTKCGDDWLPDTGVVGVGGIGGEEEDDDDGVGGACWLSRPQLSTNQRMNKASDSKTKLSEAQASTNSLIAPQHAEFMWTFCPLRDTKASKLRRTHFFIVWSKSERHFK